MENVNLTPKDIVNKNFKPKMRGYDPTEVDEFLDAVIQDYEVLHLRFRNFRLTMRSCAVASMS